jgi:hypothetical protein
MIARAGNTTHAAVELVLRRLQTRSTAPCSGERCSWAGVNGGCLLLDRCGLKRNVAPSVGTRVTFCLADAAANATSMNTRALCLGSHRRKILRIQQPLQSSGNGQLSRDSSRKGSTLRFDHVGAGIRGKTGPRAMQPRTVIVLTIITSPFRRAR